MKTIQDVQRLITDRIEKHWSDSVLAETRRDADPRWPWTVTLTNLDGQTLNELWSDVWRWILDKDSGALNRFLQNVGLVETRPGWLTNTSLALLAVIVVNIWIGIPFNATILFGGLQEVPEELYEAAELDGATGFRRFWSITWPLLANTSAFVFVIAAIASLQAFDQVYVMTRGGPFFQSETLVYLIYRKGFQDFQFGYASAVSWVLLVIVLIVSVAQNAFFSRRQVTY